MSFANPSLTKGAVGPGTIYEKFIAPHDSQQFRADVTVYYPTGMGAVTPSISGGIVTFTQLNSTGTAVKTFAIPYAGIVRGSVKEKASTVAQKKKVSLRIMNETDVDRLGRFGLFVGEVPSLGNNFDDHGYNLSIPVVPADGLTSVQRLQKVAAWVNGNTQIPVTATVDTTNELLILEADVAGVEFIVTGQGFYPEDVLVPNQKNSYLINGFRAAGLPADVMAAETNDSKALKALEFQVREFQKQDGQGHGTSSVNTEHRGEREVIKNYQILFDGADTNSNAAYTAFKAILTMSGVTTVAGTLPYIQAAPTALAAENTTLNYFFTVRRTETPGNSTQQTQAATDYAAAGRTVTFKSNNGTYSWYEIKQTSATAPTASGSDTVIAGKYGPDNTDPIS